MKRHLILSTGLSLVLASASLAAEARSTSVATNGGRASSSSVAIGNAVSDSYAGATNGGRAISNSSAVGSRWGTARSTSTALADHGLAVSNSRADARGTWWGRGVAESDSVAATIGGVAISDSESVARGYWGGLAHSESSSTATSYYGRAISDSGAYSRGLYGGRAVSVSDSLADAIGGTAVSRVRAISDAEMYGSSQSDGIGVAISGPRRHSRADVTATGAAYRWGRSSVRATAVEIRD